MFSFEFKDFLLKYKLLLSRFKFFNDSAMGKGLKTVVSMALDGSYDFENVLFFESLNVHVKLER